MLAFGRHLDMYNFQFDIFMRQPVCSPGIRDPSQYFRDPPPHVLIDSKNSARRRLNACRQDFFYNAGANFSN